MSPGGMKQPKYVPCPQWMKETEWHMCNAKAGINLVLNNNPTEAQEQKALFTWIALQGHPAYSLIHHVPNRGAFRNGYQEATGIVKGVPDVENPNRRGVYTGQHIELKRRHGSIVEMEQTWFMDNLRECGRYCTIACGWEYAAYDIITYMALRPGESIPTFRKCP